jgi:hypothetical protein
MFIMRKYFVCALALSLSIPLMLEIIVAKEAQSMRYESDSQRGTKSGKSSEKTNL